MEDSGIKASGMLSNKEETQKSNAPLVQAGFGGLTAAIHSGFGIESPFTREIFLTRQAIVGMRFQGGSDQLTADMKPGDRITFVREPENRFDQNAIMALDSQGRKLGYIPRRDNTILAALMDAGKYLYGTFADRPSSMDSYAGSTPPVLFVELYMREFAIPGDPEQIPRQGYQGSYVVIDLTLTDEGSSEPEIKDVCAIRVINGEERGMYAMSMADAVKMTGEKSGGASDREISFPEAGQEKLVQGLQRFAGYLPIVIHDDSGRKKAALENSWGIYCGKPFSNLVVNIYEMAKNHLSQLADHSLESISDWLGIGAFCDDLQENRCRMVWCIYGRFDRSELEK